jgi:hypothetical protein
MLILHKPMEITGVSEWTECIECLSESLNYTHTHKSLLHSSKNGSHVKRQMINADEEVEKREPFAHWELVGMYISAVIMDSMEVSQKNSKYNYYIIVIPL